MSNNPYEDETDPPDPNEYDELKDELPMAEFFDEVRREENKIMKIWYGRDKNTDGITGSYILSLGKLYNKSKLSISVDWRGVMNCGNEIELCEEEFQELLHKDDWLKPGEGPKEIEVLFGENLRLDRSEMYEIGIEKGKKLSTIIPVNEVEKLQKQIDHIKETFIELTIERWMSNNKKEPYKCPKCYGECTIVLTQTATSGTGKICPVCKGEGVLWK